MRNQLIFTIIVDERGLASTYQGITSTINWPDARLFAVLNPEKPSSMRFYELSNEHTVVRWVNMPTRTLVYSSQSSNEYVSALGRTPHTSAWLPRHLHQYALNIGLSVLDFHGECIDLFVMEMRERILLA